ncbi:MAG: hypothetical protein SFY56_11155 [Bacteroidota bacterium]|nr:hypothetical protein [Bacteroidota bacterium]
MENRIIISSYVSKIFCLFLILQVGRVFSQQKINYSFVVLDKNYSDSIHNKYFGKEFEIKTHRIYLKDSSFIEKNLFSTHGAKYTCDTFKVIKDKWLIKNHGKWVDFIDSENKLPYNMYVDGRKYKTILGNEKKISQNIFYELIFEPVGFEESHKDIYLFSYKNGIVGYKADNMWYLREDIIKK